MNSSLKKYQENPIILLNTALQMFRSKKIQTAVVEGVNDKRFLNQWSPNNNAIRYDGFGGKHLVENVFLASQKKPYSNYNFLYFFADVDYDIITGKPLKIHDRFVYNAFCHDENRPIFNDLETFLVNTISLEKILANHEIANIAPDEVRKLLEKASRFFGSLRAADFIVQRRNNLTVSVLNGILIEEFFIPASLSYDESSLVKNLPNWTSRKLYVDELLETSKAIDKNNPQLWALSRGHDVTEMLALYINHYNSTARLNGSKVELLLRTGCEFSDFTSSPMGRKLSLTSGIDLLKKANRVAGGL